MFRDNIIAGKLSSLWDNHTHTYIYIMYILYLYTFVIYIYKRYCWVLTRPCSKKDGKRQGETVYADFIVDETFRANSLLGWSMDGVVSIHLELVDNQWPEISVPLKELRLENPKHIVIVPCPWIFWRILQTAMAPFFPSHSTLLCLGRWAFTSFFLWINAWRPVSVRW